MKDPTHVSVRLDFQVTDSIAVTSMNVIMLDIIIIIMAILVTIRNSVTNVTKEPHVLTLKAHTTAPALPGSLGQIIIV